MNKILFPLVLVFMFFYGSLYAQRPVKTDLTPFFEQVLTPPLTCKDAYNKGICGTEAEPQECDSKILFEELTSKLERLNKEIYTTSPHSPSSDQMKMAEDFKKNNTEEKLKKMSKEEKMKYAMEMMKNVNTPKPTTESQEVKDAFISATQMTQSYSEYVQKKNAEYQKILDREKKLADGLNQIDAWEFATIDKLPQKSYGETSAPDAADVKRVKLEAADKRIKIVQEELQFINADWSETKTKYKLWAVPFCDKLAKCDYASSSSNQVWLGVFGTAQAQVISFISNLIKTSKDAYTLGARYHAAKIKIEKEV